MAVPRKAISPLPGTAYSCGGTTAGHFHVLWYRLFLSRYHGGLFSLSLVPTRPSRGTTNHIFHILWYRCCSSRYHKQSFSLSQVPSPSRPVPTATNKGFGHKKTECSGPNKAPNTLCLTISVLLIKEQRIPRYVL